MQVFIICGRIHGLCQGPSSAIFTQPIYFTFFHQESALHVAARKNDLASVRLLLRFGAAAGATSYSLNPQLSTLNPQPSTLNSQPSTLNLFGAAAGLLLPRSLALYLSLLRSRVLSLSRARALSLSPCAWSSLSRRAWCFLCLHARALSLSTTRVGLSLFMRVELSLSMLGTLSLHVRGALSLHARRFLHARGWFG